MVAFRLSKGSGFIGGFYWFEYEEEGG